MLDGVGHRADLPAVQLCSKQMMVCKAILHKLACIRLQSLLQHGDVAYRQLRLRAAGAPAHTLTRRPTPCVAPCIPRGISTSTNALVLNGLPKSLWGGCHRAPQQQAQLGQEGLPEDAALVLQPAQLQLFSLHDRCLHIIDGEASMHMPISPKIRPLSSAFRTP